MAHVIVTDDDNNSIDAYNDEQFVISFNGKYYLTQAIWIYDPLNVNNDEQYSGCISLDNSFKNTGTYLQALAVSNSLPFRTNEPYIEKPAGGTATSPPNKPG